MRIVATRSHYNKKLNPILNSIRNYKIINVGSSLKFCSVASGSADLYIRLGPTAEWDTAAGEAILSFAGGSIVNFNGAGMQYNKSKSLLNPDFIASNDKITSQNILKLINENNRDN
jgi:3'(2'), 5'-bisphosphate nucleotidase